MESIPETVAWRELLPRCQLGKDAKHAKAAKCMDGSTWHPYFLSIAFRGQNDKKLKSRVCAFRFPKAVTVSLHIEIPNTPVRMTWISTTPFHHRQ